MSITVSDINVLLLDIEGTTTSISFIKNVLLPYAKRYLADYLKQCWGETELMETIDDLRQQACDDKKNGKQDVVEIMNLPKSPTVEDTSNVQKSVIANVLWQMDLDQKTTALRRLHGLMWREEYHYAQIKTHVYEDVPLCLKKWKKQGMKIFIYSSGSIEAQKILFTSTEYGNLLPYIDGHFDTNIGSKFESRSYQKIAKIIGEKCKNILFLTDIPKETKAALDAGMQSVLIIREGNAPLTLEWSTYPQTDTFSDLKFLCTNMYRNDVNML